MNTLKDDRGIRGSLADLLMQEITRVRDEIMPNYLSIGQAGVFALTNMRRDMDRAIQALAENDATVCIEMLRSLKEYTS